MIATVKMMITKLQVVEFLTQEIATQIKYNADYKAAELKAREDAKKDSAWWFSSMPPGFDRQPNTAIIKDNARKIRKLILEIVKENTNG